MEFVNISNVSHAVNDIFFIYGYIVKHTTDATYGSYSSSIVLLFWRTSQENN